MPHLDHRGTDGKGPKTGRMLGKCRKTVKEDIEIDKSGIRKGKGKKRNQKLEQEKLKD